MSVPRPILRGARLSGRATLPPDPIGVAPSRLSGELRPPCGDMPRPSAVLTDSSMVPWQPPGGAAVIKFGPGNLRIPKSRSRSMSWAAGSPTSARSTPRRTPASCAPRPCGWPSRRTTSGFDPEQFRRMVNWCVYSQFATTSGTSSWRRPSPRLPRALTRLGNIEVRTGGATGGSAVLAAAQGCRVRLRRLLFRSSLGAHGEVTTKVGNSYIASAPARTSRASWAGCMRAYYALMAQRYQHGEQRPARDAWRKIACKNGTCSVLLAVAQNPGSTRSRTSSRTRSFPIPHVPRVLRHERWSGLF